MDDIVIACFNVPKLMGTPFFTLLQPKITALARDDVSKGYSGAEIIALCRDAALYAIGEMDEGIIDRPQIHMNHLLMSINDMKPRTTPEMLLFYESFRGRH